MKTCKDCKIEKPLSEFYLNSRRLKSGGQSRRALCTTCYALRYPTKGRSKEFNRRQSAEFRALNPTYNALAARKFRKSHPAKIRAWNAESKAAKINATPPWLTEEQRKEIQRIYADCPAGMQVDHIVPLRAKEVRGLHVPWNLQYLTPAANLAKGNRKIG